MKRQSVAFFLGDVGFLADPKFRALARRLPESDKFNSAVGAYFIALAASRRNGRPAIDAHAETDSSYVATLQEVGLLTADGFPVDSWKEWAPTRPQAVAGAARADGAERDDAGRFTSALDSAGGLVQPSPPLLSTPLPSNQGNGERVLGGEDDLWRLYSGITGIHRINPNTLTWLEQIETAHGVENAATALRSEFERDPKIGTLLSRTAAVLERAAHKAEIAKMDSAKSERILADQLARRTVWERETGKPWLETA